MTNYGCPRCKSGIQPPTRFCSNCGTEVDWSILLPQIEKEKRRNTADTVIFWVSIGIGLLLGILSVGVGFMLYNPVIGTYEAVPRFITGFVIFGFGTFVVLKILGWIIQKIKGN